MSGGAAPVGPGAATETVAATGRRPRIAYLGYWTTRFDSRLERMVRTSLADGWEVVVYGRLMDGLPAVEEREGYTIRRVPAVPSFRALLGLRPGAAAIPADGPASAASPSSSVLLASPASVVRPPARSSVRPRGLRGRLRALTEGSPFDGAYRALRRRWHGLRRWLLHPLDRLDDRRLAPRRWILFLEEMAGWALALDAVAEPADVWHGLSYGSLPALVRQSRRLGGAAVYDALDVYVEARTMAAAAPLRRRLHLALERRWVRRCAAVVTVNDAYATRLAALLRIPTPPVLLNVPEPVALALAEPRPRRFHEALGLDPATKIVCYQGGLLSDRGIEEGMEAILEVPGAVLVLLGYGPLRAALEERIAIAPYAGKVFLVDAVPPAELLSWTASADVALMAIQPTSRNHLLTTPNKLWEAMAAGVPIVASDLPGMAGVLRETGAGILCDPTEIAAIARAIREALAAPRASALGRAGSEAAARRYNWSVEAETLRDLHRGLLPARMRG